METADTVMDLLRPEAYPWRPATVELIETHISWVFLAGDRVVKIKRPVNLGFVDHTTLAQRHHSCEEEVRLNRRLTSEVYLSAAPITREDHGLIVDGHGPVVEWSTLMRRLPSHVMLDALLRNGNAPEDLGDRLADCLIPFHAGDAPACPGDPDALTEMVLEVVMANLDEVAAFSVAPVELGLVANAMRSFAHDRRQWLQERSRAGWIRDGHGDLRCEHICLEPDRTPQVFDCVEFSQDLRCADVASDLAFLLMDLDRLGAGGAAARLLARYREAGFDLPNEILRFYWSHRALVRAKVWLLRDPDHLTHANRAVAYLHHALRQVLHVPPAVFCMTGLSGTGKSVIGKELALALGLPVLSSDHIRKELAGVSGSAADAWEEGIYTTEQKEATYREIHARARDLLSGGESVALDATFLDSQRRLEASRVAASLNAPFVLIETTCDVTEIRRRLHNRTSEGKDPSDAGTDIYERQLAAVRSHPPRVPDGAIHIVIDTTAPGPAPLEPILRELDRLHIVTARIRDMPLRLA